MEDFKIYKDEWWPMPVWYTDIDVSAVDPALIVDEANLLKNLNFGKDHRPKSLSWCSHNIKDTVDEGKLPEMKKLKDTVLKLTPIISADFGFKNPNLDVVEMWTTFQFPNGMQTPHTHQYTLGAVYYAHATDDMGKIWFLNSGGSAVANKSLTQNINKYTFEQVEYSPIIGRLLLFPSWLPHMTNVNYTNQDRISVAFDLK